MKRSSLLALILLHAVAVPAAHAATNPQLALPSQQAEDPPPTPVGDPYLPPGTDIFAPQTGSDEEPSPLNPADD